MFASIKNIILKSVGKDSGTRITKTVFKKKNTRKIILPDFKIYCIVPLIKSMWYWQRDKPLGQWR